MTRSRFPVRLLGIASLGLFLVSGAAHAQYAPPPQKAPRTPVRKETLEPPKPALPASRLVAGMAHILDTERLKVDDIELRLFGVVPPQLSASFGPQARNVVDTLAQGTVTCKIRDRDRDGRLLASCASENGADFGVELLRRGLAVTARGSLRPTELAQPYVAAEDAAKTQRLGLWSVKPPAAASESSIQEAAHQADAAKKEEAKAQQQELKAKEAQAEQAKAADLPPPALDVVPIVNSSSTTPVPQIKPDEMLKISLGPSAADIQALLEAPTESQMIAATPVQEKGFFETYQILMTGLIGLMTVFVAAASYVFCHLKDKRDELRAIAAALRGEMMAARAICLARLSKIAHDKDERATSWPRIRTLVFQAYVGRLGHLGADLARQIASVYGQASDYASYYVGAEGKPEVSSKRQSLQTLVQHIEEVVPKLSDIERAGTISRPQEHVALSSLLARVVKPLTLAAPKIAKIFPPDGGTAQPAATPLPAPEKAGALQPKEETKEEPKLVSLEEAKTEIVSETVADVVATENHEALKEEKPQEAAEAKREEEPLAPIITHAEAKALEPALEEKSQSPKVKADLSPQPTPAPQPKAKTKRPLSTRAAAASTTARTTKPAAKPIETKAAEAPAKNALPEKAAALWSAMRKMDVKTEIKERMDRLKAMAALGWVRAAGQKPYDNLIPDYANLTEEELEALAYSGEDLFLSEIEDEYRKTA